MEITVEDPAQVIDFKELEGGDVFTKNERLWIKIKKGTDTNPVVAVALDNGDLLRDSELAPEDDVLYREDAYISLSAAI